MKELIAAERVFVAKPPLFTIQAGKDERYYAIDEAQRDEILRGLKKKDIRITRFKGLGEMDAEQLEETAMNPQSRSLIKISLEEENKAEAEILFSKLMGEKVEPRRQFIEKHAKEVTDLDWHY
jgi:DNA gyrase subunit B